MFSSAYIAEIVRGGLQAVPQGQTEAGQAMGMSPAKITRLLVLPQALRAVIPSMVGQFISLFKDTSLLTIITVLEFLGTREIVHTQEAFRGFGLVETLDVHLVRLGPIGREGATGSGDGLLRLVAGGGGQEEGTEQERALHARILRRVRG